MDILETHADLSDEELVDISHAIADKMLDTVDGVHDDEGDVPRSFGWDDGPG